MATILGLYERSIFRNLGSAMPTPKTATLDKPVQNMPPAMNETNSLKMAEQSYQSAPRPVRSALAGDTIFSTLPSETSGKERFSDKTSYALTSAKRLANYLVSPKGLQMIFNQTMIQTFNPTIETKIWNPLSLFSNTLPVFGYHERRHMSLSSLFGLDTSFIKGAVPETYTQAVFSSEYKSRNIHQSPQVSIGKGDEYPGLDYANVGRDIMTMPQTYFNLNPNKYLYPIGADGAGLPLTSRLSPREEMKKNIGLATQAFRFTMSTGYNPIIDAQITMNQEAGAGFLSNLLKAIPYSDVLLKLLGYGIMGTKATEIKIFNRYNPTYGYVDNTNLPKFIRMLNKEGRVIATYDILNSESPLAAMLEGIKKIQTIDKGKPTTGTFQSREELARKLGNTTIPDNRILRNPQDNAKLNKRYLQSYGDIVLKRGADAAGGANIVDLGSDQKLPYTKELQKNKTKTIYVDYGFANPGAAIKETRLADKINTIPYGEDYPSGVTDLIPFKFYHVNNAKWIIFRAALTGLTDSITPDWNSRKYIGRADNVYIYKGATRVVNFGFKVSVHSEIEVRPVWEKVNYLIGLCYPKYRDLSDNEGKYMEAPFVKLTIGDLFANVPGILNGGITISIPDEATWEVRDSTPNKDSSGKEIDIAKLPRFIEVTISGFTIFGLDNSPISSTSPFYSAIKNWKTKKV